MAQRPAFGALKKAKPAPAAATPAPADAVPAARIQTSVRLEPAMWAALNDLATRKRIEGGRRVTVHDLLIEGGHHVLATNGIKLSK
jgi:predicted DNA-binding ribbon-helix-helix protein